MQTIDARRLAKSDGVRVSRLTAPWVAPCADYPNGLLREHQVRTTLVSLPDGGLVDRQRLRRAVSATRKRAGLSVTHEGNRLVFKWATGRLALTVFDWEEDAHLVSPDRRGFNTRLKTGFFLARTQKEKEMTEALVNEAADEDEDEESGYTYSLFDGDPNVSGHAWPTHYTKEIDADSDEDAVELVTAELDTQARGLSPADGYEVGDSIWAIVYYPDGRAEQIERVLTAEDLGIEEHDEYAEDDEDLKRAIEALNAKDLGDDEYAYQDSATRSWWVVDDLDLADYGARLAADDADVYSIWCADTVARQLSAEEAHRLELE